MKYQFMINQSLTEEEGKGLYAKIQPLGANLTVLEKKSYAYGHTDSEDNINKVEQIISESGFPVERW